MHFTIPLVALCAGVALAAPQGTRQQRDPKTNINKSTSTSANTRNKQGNVQWDTRTVSDDGTTQELNIPITPGGTDYDDGYIDDTSLPGSSSQAPKLPPLNPSSTGSEYTGDSYSGTEIDVTRPGLDRDSTTPGGTDPYYTGQNSGQYRPTNTKAGSPPGRMLDVRNGRLNGNSASLGGDLVAQRIAQLPPMQSCPESKKCEEEVYQKAQSKCYVEIGRSPLYTQSICDLQHETARRGCARRCQSAARRRGDDVASNGLSRSRTSSASIRDQDRIARDNRRRTGSSTTTSSSEQQPRKEFVNTGSTTVETTGGDDSSLSTGADYYDSTTGTTPSTGTAGNKGQTGEGSQNIVDTLENFGSTDSTRSTGSTPYDQSGVVDPTSQF